METRVILVPANSRILQDATTVQLHAYPNGDVLVRTAATVSEEGEPDETPVAQGLRITGAADADIKLARADSAQSLMAYVGFIGPIDPAWLDALRKADIEPLRYHPENSYLCKASSPASFKKISKLDFVTGVTPLTSDLKPKIGLLAEDGEDAQIVVQGSRGQEKELIRQLGALPGVEIRAGQDVEQVDFYLRIRARVTPEGQDALRKDPRVLAVEHFETAHPEDEVANLILCGQYDLPGRPNGSYLKWLEDNGINGSGVTIGIVDNGVDVSHAAFKGRITDLTGGKKSWHGTFVAGHAAGAYLAEKDHNQFIYGIGLAPAANLLVQDNSLSATTLCKQTVTEKTGLVQNNSWGKGTQNPMDYSSDEATYDQMVRNADPGSAVPKPITVCFSSGNSGQAGLTRPKAAKNVIITGNSENYRPDVGGDNSDNIREVYTGPHPSSWGNCGDGRIRPHVVAPGEWTSSANYDSHPGEAEYISAQLTWGGGSSGASPKTTAACALLIHWWRNHHSGAIPSPAVLRALIVNGAEPMVTGGPIPNNVQGWGRLNLGNILDQSVAHIYSDQEHLLKQLSDQKVWNIVVGDPTKPLKVTLAWTDPPGPIGSGGNPSVSTIVNKLALRVESAGLMFRANQFQQGWSVSGTSASDEGRDNLQNIFISAGGATGKICVSVTALNVTTNCLTGLVDTPQQDFALVIGNGHLDVSTSPTEVTVGVDTAATGDPKPNSQGDYWTDQPGSSDDAHLNSNWWSDSTTSGSVVGGDSNSPPAATLPSDSSNSNEVDNWWGQVDQIWGSKPESDKAPLTGNSGFVDALAAGLEIAVGTGRTVAAGSTGPAPEAGGGIGATELVMVSANAQRTTDAKNAAAGSAVDLSATLSRLLEVWQAASTSKGNAVPRRSAVLVVGGGTRVSAADIAAMAKATMLGELYLVSADPALLIFLAQRVHRTRGIQFRLAADNLEMAQLARDTLAEAAGLQQLGVDTSVRETDGAVFVSTFQAVAADRTITVQVTYDQGSPLTSLQVFAPGQTVATTVLPRRKTKTYDTVERPGFVQFSLTPPKDGTYWAGTWQVVVGQRASKTGPVTKVWADSLLKFEVMEKNTTASADGERSLIVLSGDPGVKFTAWVIKSARVASGQPQRALETDKETVLRAPVSRLDRDGSGAQEESVRAQGQSPRLSYWATLPKTIESAFVLDLRTEVQGVDVHGQPFRRLLTRNILRLEARSGWRKRISGAKKALVTPANVEKFEYSDGEIVGLRIRRGAQQRFVAVQAPLLRQELSRLRLRDLQKKTCGVRVEGSELVGFFVWLDSRGAGAAASGA